jgi:hypothetical protein
MYVTLLEPNCMSPLCAACKVLFMACKILKSVQAINAACCMTPEAVFLDMCNPSMNEL